MDFLKKWIFYFFIILDYFIIDFSKEKKDIFHFEKLATFFFFEI
jgi:hypothetical protein